MTKFLLILAVLLFTISVSAQKKVKQQKTPPVKEEVVPPAIQEPVTTNENDAPLIMPESALTRINAIKTDGQNIRLNALKELDNLNFSQLKELSFSTMISNKVLDNQILQKIMDDATQLEVLEIDNFTIETFPEIKTPNDHLKKLTLNKNNLKTLSSSILNLVVLEDFSCTNPLQELPASFSQLKNLKELGLYSTELEEFPKVVFSLNTLSVLYISGKYKGTSKIKELPDLFQQLPELKELGITSASLSALPASFSALKKLEKIDFSGNQFADFPEVLAANPNLQYVPFTGNPLQWDAFLASVKKIKWRGLFFLYETGFTKKQYEEIQKILSKIDVYYDGMND